MKNNLAEDGAVPGLAFELVEGRIRWRKEVVPELAEVLLPSVHNNDRRRLRRAACEWLQEALADGPLPSAEVIQQALSCGISRGTLTRAITDLGIKSHKTGFNGGWEMRWTPAVEPCRSVAWSGLRIVGAGDETCGQADTETRRQGEGERRSDGERERRRGGSKRKTGQGDTETRGHGEAVADVNANCASSEKCEEMNAASCASSEKSGDSLMASCASSENRDDFTRLSCASSEEGPDVARSPDLATAASAPPCGSPRVGDLPSAGCQDRETLTKQEKVSCASSRNCDDSSMLSCASSEKRDDSSMASCASSEEMTDRGANRPQPSPGRPLAGAQGEGEKGAGNPKSKIENPKFAVRHDEEEPLPHWMERWYKRQVG